MDSSAFHKCQDIEKAVMQLFHRYFTLHCIDICFYLLTIMLKYNKKA